MTVSAPNRPGVISAEVVGVDDAKAGLDQAAALVRKLMGDAMYDIARDILQEAQRRLAPQNRSHNLSQSAAFEVPEATLDEITLALGFQANYAAFRNFGGTIVPVRADVLAIPQKPILDGNGESIYANPRQEPTLFVFRWIGFDGTPRAGLAMKVGDKIEVHWVFKDSVTQQGSDYFTGTIAERAPHVGAIAASIIDDGLSNGRAA